MHQATMQHSIFKLQDKIFLLTKATRFQDQKNIDADKYRCIPFVTNLMLLVRCYVTIKMALLHRHQVPRKNSWNFS